MTKQQGDEKGEGHIRTRSIRFNLRHPTDEVLWQEVKDEMEAMRWELNVIPSQVGAMKRIMVRGVDPDRLPQTEEEAEEEARQEREAIRRKLDTLLNEVRNIRARDPDGFERIMRNDPAPGDGGQPRETNVGDAFIENMLDGGKF